MEFFPHKYILAHFLLIVLCVFLYRERLTFQNTSFFLGRRTLYWILHSGEIMYAPMNLEIIVEYWNCMISYFMLSACRLIFQKIEFLEFNFFAFIIAPKMLHSFSFLLRSIFFDTFVRMFGSCQHLRRFDQSWICQLFIIFRTHLTSDCLLNAQENTLV